MRIFRFLSHHMEGVFISMIRRNLPHLRIDRGILLLLFHQMERIFITMIRRNFFHIIFKLIIFGINCHSMPSIFMLSCCRHSNYILLISLYAIRIKTFTSKDTRNRFIFKQTFTICMEVSIFLIRIFIIKINICLIHNLTIINLIFSKCMLIIGIINTSIGKSSINRFHIHINCNSISCF